MSQQLKAIILDVDGVIVGEKIGFNSPDPHIDVIKSLKDIQNSGIPIILCTAKPHFALKKLIFEAELDNFHITDGGGVVIDPIHDTILSKQLIPTTTVRKVTETLLKSNVYTELYTTDNYFIQSSQACEITAKHNLVLQCIPQRLGSLTSELVQLQVTKIMPIAKDPTDKLIVNEILQQFIPEVVISWGVHPVILPLQFGIVTAPGISKNIAAHEILSNLGILPTDTLGVGDSTSDWQFIEPCGYGCAMGNASSELKELVLSKGKENSFIAPSVDENGILAVFRHFGLINK